MEQTELIVVQLEEAKRMMDVGEPPHLRLAFMLLDNATELSMKRIVETELSYNDFHLRLIDFWKAALESPEGERQSEKIEETLKELKEKSIPQKKVDKIESYYDEKVNFLKQREIIEESIARTIKKLHHYRNEVYHRDIIPRGSIEPATIIYFDIACLIFSSVSPDPIIWPTPPPIQRLRERYSTDEQSLGSSNIASAVGENLRDQLGIDTDSVRKALASHLESRLQQIDEDIEFVKENISLDVSKADTFKLIQHEDYTDDVTLQDVIDADFRYCENDFTKWRTRIKKLAKETDRYRMFARFADIEDDFEPLEKRASDVALEVDRHIQLQIDIARGK